MEPGRNALALLVQAVLSDWADALFPQAPRELVRQAARGGINAPISSSAGRVFDAFAACLGICPMGQSFEGQAAMLLETLARQASDTQAGFGFDIRGDEIDPAPMWQEMRRLQGSGAPAEQIAWQFHAGLAGAFARVARALVEAGEAQAVALSGGCFQNELLLKLTIAALGDVPVLIHRTTRANDGGLAFGQAPVAAAQGLKE